MTDSQAIADKDRKLFRAVLANFEGTPLYEDFKLEQEEILRHKWLESEKAGEDIGFGQALESWLLSHRNDWVVNERPLKRTRN